MLSQGVEDILRKAASDSEFKNMLHTDTAGAVNTCKQEGCQLSDEEAAMLGVVFAKSDSVADTAEMDARETSGFTSIG